MDIRQISEWNARYFDGRLSPAVSRALAAAPGGEDVAAFLERYFALMRRAGAAATDLSPTHGLVLGAILPAILPGGASDRIPPVTMPGRHQRLDAFVRANRYRPAHPGLFLDVGCGFPPTTVHETAAALPGWRVVAADPAMPSWVVYDGQGNYATFGADQEILYMQPEVPSAEGWRDLLCDRPSSQQRFRELFSQLHPQLDSQPVAAMGDARIVNTVLQKAQEGIEIEAAAIGEVEIADVQVIRCYNVLVYYDAAFRRAALAWFGQILAEGGLLLVGTNWAATTECRSSVYQKVSGELVHQEFSFGLDNLCPIGVMPWLSLVDDDYETLALADAARVLRADALFWSQLSSLSDRLREEHGLGARQDDGHLGPPDASLAPQDLWRASAARSHIMDARLAEAATGVLERAGHEAWVSDTGQVALRPSSSVAVPALT